MYNHTYYEVPIIIHKNPNKIDPLVLVICFGTIIYSLCGIFNIDIDIIIQDRFNKYIFNMILLFSSLVIIINIIYVNYIFNIINIVNNLF
jgi:hypothetical protein